MVLLLSQMGNPPQIQVGHSGFLALMVNKLPMSTCKHRQFAARYPFLYFVPSTSFSILLVFFFFNYYYSPNAFLTKTTLKFQKNAKKENVVSNITF